MKTKDLDISHLSHEHESAGERLEMFLEKSELSIQQKILSKQVNITIKTFISIVFGNLNCKNLEESFWQKDLNTFHPIGLNEGFVTTDFG